MDRRTIWAILLMMVIAIAPAIFIKRTPKPAASAAKPAGGHPADTTRPAPRSPAAQAPAPADTAAPAAPVPTATARGADTVWVTSPLYTYGVSTAGGRLIEARLARYQSMWPPDHKSVARILPPDSKLLDMAVVLGADTISLGDWTFKASTDSLAVGTGPTPLNLTASKGAISLDLTYAFRPDDYQIAVTGRVTGVGPNGGQLLVALGPTLANTEANEQENQRALALVTKRNEADRTDFSGLKPGEPRTISGPLEWAAIKSKYFVTAVLAFDSTGGGISGVTAEARKTTEKHPTSADVRLSMPLRASGEIGYTVYAGPMEYDRLQRVGHDFDDVNPYGWPGFRTVIRPVAAAVRWLLVWMHDHLSLPYGLVLVFFGVLVRVLLWPLNQKAMRTSMKMQRIQPELTALQTRYKSDPQKLQSEMMRVYKDHGMSPFSMFSGCLPLLLPMPVLFALFFVFQSTIEFRGVPFMWLADISQKDPFYILPLVMGISMFVLSWIGSRNTPPNPQTKMMLYLFPVMMTFLLANLAAGLNLYYAVQNLAALPQQWIIANERARAAAKPKG